jgi:isoamylase
MAFTSWHEPTPFVVPPSPQGRPWRRVIDTGMTAPYDIVELDEGPHVPEGKAYVLAPYSMLVLIAEG